MTYYAVLGVPEDASSESIHNAFRALARQFHPDAGAGSSAGKFRDAVEAYETLNNPARRRAYDALLARNRAQPSRPQASRPYSPTPAVVVEPLAQPWFQSAVPFTQRRIIDNWLGGNWPDDNWFDEVLRSFDELFWR